MTRPTAMTRRSRPGALHTALAALAAAALAGCASPPSRFYTLSDALASSSASSASSPQAPMAAATAATTASPAIPAGAPAAPYALEVSPVSVPEQVDRPQIVVTRGGGRVDILEESRWAAPLKTELTSAISRDLTQRLGAMDVYGLPRADGLAVYRVATSVQRFESVPGEQAALTAVWSVRRVPGDLVLTCRFNATEPAAGDIDGVVAAQRRLVERLAQGIGDAIAVSAQGAATPRCQN